MSIKFSVRSIFFLVLIGVVAATENYMDYADETPERSPAENIRELYKLLFQRNALQNAVLGDIPLEHLMIRKSQRSPTLRLRFGRSDPHLSMGVMPRPMNMIASPGFEDNN